MTPAESAAIEDVLDRSRSLGFLGPGSVRVQVDHAVGFAAGPAVPATALPAASSIWAAAAGCPASSWPTCGRGREIVLLDAGARRGTFLEEAVAELGLERPRAGGAGPGGVGGA